MAYTLSINSIYPTTFTSTDNQTIRIDFSLSGFGIGLPGFRIDLYSKLTGGSLVKTLYVETKYDLEAGISYLVSLADIASGTYYVEVYYRTVGTPRKAITITSSHINIRNLTLNGTKITNNRLNNNEVSLETLNNNKVYE